MTVVDFEGPFSRKHFSIRRGGGGRVFFSWGGLIFKWGHQFWWEFFKKLWGGDGVPPMHPPSPHTLRQTMGVVISRLATDLASLMQVECWSATGSFSCFFWAMGRNFGGEWPSGVRLDIRIKCFQCKPD